MTYNPGIPTPASIPASVQPGLLTNFSELNTVMSEDHFTSSLPIVSCTLAAPMVLTVTEHNLKTGDSVTVYDMEGIDDLGVKSGWVVNGQEFTITVLSSDTFSLNGTDSTPYDPYVESSGFIASDSIPEGEHKKISFRNLNAKGNSQNPALFSFIENFDLLDTVPSFFMQGLRAVNLFPSKVTTEGSGFLTPWGLIINTGIIDIQISATIPFDFPIPYTKNVFSIVGSIFGPFGVTPGIGITLTLTPLSVARFQGRLNVTQGAGFGSFSYLAVGV